MAKRIREDSISASTSPLQGTPDDSLDSASHTPKYVELDDMPADSPRQNFKCALPPHKPLAFPSYSDYETHYNNSHSNRCRECHKNLPSPHFLDLHISENHDPIVGAKRDKGEKTFACFVEDCDKICADWKKRRSHLVDKHGFPKNYDFFIVNNGIDGRRSMLRPGVDADGHRRSSRERRGSSATQATQTTEATSVSQRTEEVSGAEGVAEAANMGARGEGKKEDKGMDELTKSMSSLQFVPRSVTFGKRKGKSGFAKS